MASFNLQHDTEEQSYLVIKKLINYLEEKDEKYEINLFPYFMHDNWDMHFLNRMVEKINNPNVYIGKSVETLEEYLSESKKYDYFISARYHIALIQNVLGSKFLLLNYDTHRHYINKNKYLYDHYDFIKNIINLSNIDNIESNFDDLFNNKTKTKLLSKKTLKAAQDDLLDILNSI